jgi:hypothetical protein
MKFLVALTFLSLSAQPVPSKDKVVALMKAMNMESMMQNMISQQLDAFRKLAPKVPQKFWDEAAKDLKADDLISLSADIYARHFSAEEIDDLLRFYSSPTGKKILVKLPIIMNESMDMGRQWGSQVAAKIGERLKAEGYLDPPKPQ